MSDGTQSPPDEFAGIPVRRTRHPILAAAVVALAVFLAWRVRHDVGYALSSSEPQTLGDVRALAGRPLPVNRYVRLSGPADHESAVILDTQGEWQFAQLLRLLGTGSRFYVRRVPDPLPIDRAEGSTYSGRLIRFADLSFAPAIRRHFATHVSATHFFRLEDLRAALDQQTPSLVDTLGERVTLAAEDELVFDLARPGEIRLELPKERVPDEAAARALVGKHQGEVVTVEKGPPDRHVLFVRFPEAERDRALSAIGDVDRRVRITNAHGTVRLRWRDLSAQTLPKGDVQVVRTAATVVIPDDAYLLVEGDVPRNHIKTVAALAVLVAFALVNLLALRRTA